MDADERREAEALREWLTMRGVWTGDPPDSLIGLRVWNAEDECAGTLAVCPARRKYVQWDDGDDSRLDVDDCAPLLSAPATWGVLLGLLAEAQPAGLAIALCGLTASDEGIRRDNIGLALSRALRATGGQA